jgi:hypothetical protein
VTHERGLRLFRDGPRWYCSSASHAGGCHYVTGLSCDCPGFVSHGRCTHHALLLERLGWLPELEAESDLQSHEAFAESIDCPTCAGCGVVVYRSFEERCPDCGGSGIRPDHRLAGRPAVEVVAAAA